MTKIMKRIVKRFLMVAFALHLIYFYAENILTRRVKKTTEETDLQVARLERNSDKRARGFSIDLIAPMEESLDETRVVPVLHLQKATRPLDTHDPKVTLKQAKSKTQDQQQLVVYNRVAKCASTTMVWIISQLRKRNKFSLKWDNWPFLKQYLSDAEKIQLLRNVTAAMSSSGTIFVRHLHFMDFSKYYSFLRPAYINVVRDPVERFISHYYYMRHGFQGNADIIKGGWRKGMDDGTRSETIDQCVYKGAEECVRKNSMTMLAIFCGQEEGCRKQSQWALNRAKKNLVAHYLVVGIAEDLPNTLKLLEYELPRYFKGAPLVYAKSASVSQRTKTSHKLPPSDDVKRKLRYALKYEVQFYEFAKARFYQHVERMKQNPRRIQS